MKKWQVDGHTVYEANPPWEVRALICVCTTAHFAHIIANSHNLLLDFAGAPEEVPQ